MPFPHYFIKLSDNEREEVSRKLQNYSITNRHVKRRRLQSIWFSNQRLTEEQISKRLKVTCRTVQRWFRLYRQKGLNGF
ncbi:MAG: helix-turn-helix domain-containing protein [Planctomycetota bacterium]